MILNIKTLRPIKELLRMVEVQFKIRIVKKLFSY